MTTEEIIRMAREAGFADGVVDIVGLAGFAIFAALVRADEREECAKVCEAGVVQTSDWDASYWNQACENRAAAIRARGEK